MKSITVCAVVVAALGFMGPVQAAEPGTGKTYAVIINPDLEPRHLENAERRTGV